MYVFWRIFTDTKSKAKAELVLARCVDRIGEEIEELSIDDYHKGGHVVCFQIPLKSSGWSDAVIEGIEYGQRVGYSWSLSGSVLNDLDAHCSEFQLSGITFANWILKKPLHTDDESQN